MLALISLLTGACSNAGSSDAKENLVAATVNGKSIMGLMMLAAGPGSKLTIYAEGNDASAALAELETLIKRKFDEE